MTRSNNDSSNPEPSIRIRNISEAEIASLIEKAGGKIAHPDADRRSQRGGDFVLGDSVIELKILEEEGLYKEERQKKIADLFSTQFPGRPVIVLDSELLDQGGQRAYDNIVEGPIKVAVRSARQQLAQSRIELGAKTTVLWVINNGYTSLGHDELVKLVARRARNDTKEIDAVVVSGAYFYSDTFQSYFLWPFDSELIQPSRSFGECDILRGAWDDFVMQRMNALMREPPAEHETKGPIVDVAFKVDDVTYLMPTPPMGKSEFFVNGRPRQNSTGIKTCPPLATIFAEINPEEWRTFQPSIEFADLPPSYEEWTARKEVAQSECTLQPFLAMPITYTGWIDWAKSQEEDAGVSVHRYAETLFADEIRRILDNSKERIDGAELPPRYLLMVTEEIGQDQAFDLSHLAEIRGDSQNEDNIHEIWWDRSMFFAHALSVAATEALVRGIDHLFWQKEQTYGWS